MKRNFFISGFVSFTFSVLFWGCNKEEPIPSYVHIDKITLSTIYSNEGSASNKILDAWVYIDDQFVGAFELPCTFPVLTVGTHTISVLSGIKENGITETRIPYPFYEKYVASIVLVAGEKTQVNPTTKYAALADFSWIEDFEGASPGICNNLGVPDTNMKVVNTPGLVFELTGSGEVLLTGSATSYFGMSCNKYALPKVGAPVFIELNYNCNTDFNVGIIGYSGSNIEVQSISLTLRPTTGWNKVYINLTNEVTGAVSASTFAIFFSLLKDPDLTASYVYLDNVKLVN